MQQALAVPGVLEGFSSRSESDALRASFAALYGLEEDGGAPVDKAVQQAIAAPASYVLKPQREGGGNNLYGEELQSALQTMSPAERASFILMERIVPSTSPMPMMREGGLDGGESTCELGVYGVHLSDGVSTLVDDAAGHLLRVKLAGVDEGGVCAGFAVLASPVLC